MSDSLIAISEISICDWYFAVSINGKHYLVVFCTKWPVCLSFMLSLCKSSGLCLGQAWLEVVDKQMRDDPHHHSNLWKRLYEVSLVLMKIQQKIGNHCFIFFLCISGFGGMLLIMLHLWIETEIYVPTHLACLTSKAISYLQLCDRLLDVPSSYPLCRLIFF